VTVMIPTLIHTAVDIKAPKTAVVFLQLQLSVYHTAVRKPYIQRLTWTDNATSKSKKEAKREGADKPSRYMKLGLMGVTIVYSSGDNGVAGRDDTCCYYNNCYGGYMNAPGTGGGFSPSFPASVRTFPDPLLLYPSYYQVHSNTSIK